MANNTATPNVWTQMNYVPPRGQCNFKPSFVSAKCTCLRFMLHPLKSSSSYECDGCNHHASFHSMENKSEDEVRKRWEVEERERQEQQKRPIARPRKRLRELEYTGAVGSDNTRLLENGILTPDEMSDGSPILEESEGETTRAKTRASGRGRGRGRGNANVNVTAKKGGKSTETRAAAVRARGRVIQELLDGEDTIELD